jgi:hypothetical protein
MVLFGFFMHSLDMFIKRILGNKYIFKLSSHTGTDFTVEMGLFEMFFGLIIVPKIDILELF